MLKKLEKSDEKCNLILPNPSLGLLNKSVNLKEVYIDRGKPIGFGGFSRVYEITVYPVNNFFDLKICDNNTIKNKLEKETGILNRNGALKYVTVSPNSGLESLMEMHIMHHIKHPCINGVLGIQVDPLGNISLVQDLSIGDASMMIRKTGHKLNPMDLRRWVWNITCGLAEMHRHGILHGDIKCGNLLLYYIDKNGKMVDKNKKGICDELSNVEIKLNDFSLSRLIIDPVKGTKDLPRNISYTSTHRPIEVWKRQNYTFSADMWSLGCTLYELTYGMLLFPDQNSLSKTMEVEANIKAFRVWSDLEKTPITTPLKTEKDDEHHLNELLSPVSGVIARKRSDGLKSSPIKIPRPRDKYSNYFNTKLSSSAPINCSSKNVNHKEINISSEWSNKENSFINDIILGLLEVNPLNRYNVWDIIDHEYFDEVRDLKEYSNLLPSEDECNFSKITYPVDGDPKTFLNDIKNLSIDKDVSYLAMALYQRSKESNVTVPQPTISGCIVAANKLIYRAPPESFGIVGTLYLQDEINLCSRLNYNLLPHTNDGTQKKI